MINKQNGNNQKEIEIKEIQIADFAQFIDVMDAIASLKSIKQVRKDIQIRKKLIQEEIDRMQGSIEQKENK